MSLIVALTPWLDAVVTLTHWLDATVYLTPWLDVVVYITPWLDHVDVDGRSVSYNPGVQDETGTPINLMDSNVWESYRLGKLWNRVTDEAETGILRVHLLLTFHNSTHSRNDWRRNIENGSTIIGYGRKTSNRT